MFSSAKRARDRSRSSQRSSLEIHSERTSVSQIPEPTNSTIAAGTGTKRLFSNRQSKLSSYSDHGETEEPDAPTVTHSDKRQRSGAWPLPASSPVESARDRLRGRNTPHSPSARRSGEQNRPSRFVEGSMNDRVSQKPPVPYLGTDEDLLDEYQAEQEAYKNRGGKPRPTSCVPSTTGQSDTSRHSSIFRFGKSIAASFNPSNWKLFKSQAEPEEMETPQQRVLRERREKAEKIYAELKQSGRFPNVQSFEAFGASVSANKHDSGVEFTESNPRSSDDSSVGTEEKRKGRVFLEAPNLSRNYGAETPSSVAGSGAYSSTSSPSKTFSHFKKASLSNIKKRFTNDSGSVADYSGGDHSVRKAPSRRDLQKQQRLSKKVSDLEGKLEAARRQLNEALAEPLPTPGQQWYSKPKFVPGAMPSLLSERLLSSYLPPGDQLTDEDDFGKAVEYPLSERMDVDERRGRSESAGPEGKTNGSKYGSINGRRVSSSGYPTKPIIKKKPIHPYDDDEDFEEAITKDSKAATVISSADSGMEKDDDIEADELSPIMSPSEQLASELTSKQTLKSTSHTSTPTKSPNQTTSHPPKASAKKRKSFDDDAAYKPTATASDASNSEYDPKSRTAATRRKAVGGGAAAIHKKKSPPRRAPPPIPTSAPTQQQQEKAPPAKSLKTSSTSSPSSSTSAVPASPARQISRKAINTSTSKSTTTRLAKPKTNSKHIIENNRARQSVSPPPSKAAFTGMDNIPVLLHPSTNSTTDDVATTTNPYPSVHDSDSSIPPMPKLPTSVRLPNGQVVEVKAGPRMPVARKAASIASSSTGNRRASSRIRAGGRRVVNASAAGGAGGDEEDVDGEEKSAKRKESGIMRKEVPTSSSSPQKKKTLSKSDTQASFEWPSDCF